MTRMHRGKLVGIALALGAGLAALAWYAASAHYEAGVAELRAEIAQRGWPSSQQQLLTDCASPPQQLELVAALEGLRSEPGDSSAPLAPHFERLLLARGALTPAAGQGSPALAAAGEALQTPEFERVLAAVDALVPGQAWNVFGRDASGLARCSVPLLLVQRASSLLRIRAELALSAGRAGEAAVDARRLLALADALIRQPAVSVSFTARGVRRNGLCVLRDALEAAPLPAAEAARVEALLAAADPAREFARAFDGERVLFGDAAWALVRALPARVWFQAGDELALETSCLRRPFLARAERAVLRYWIDLRAHAEQHPFEAFGEPDASALPALAAQFLPISLASAHASADERRALDLARLALAGGAGGETGAARDPLSGEPYARGERDGRQRLRARGELAPPFALGWPLDWPVRG